MAVLARRAGERWRTAVYFRSAETLYGRYWGAAADLHSLHFEACYYQGIEYCIERGLKRFEPGTQGEHKLARGFEPTFTWSAHWLADRELRQAVARYLDREAAGRGGVCRRGGAPYAVSGLSVIAWLAPGDPPASFPPVERALREPSGLLAAGGDLSCERLLAAYRRGIFPWYSPGQPVLWWSPDPRAVLFPRNSTARGAWRARCATGGFEYHVGSGLRGGAGGLRGTAAREPRHLDHRRDAGGLPEPAPPGHRPQRRDLARRAAGRRGLWGATGPRVISASRCSA